MYYVWHEIERRKKQNETEKVFPRLSFFSLYLCVKVSKFQSLAIVKSREVMTQFGKNKYTHSIIRRYMYIFVDINAEFRPNYDTIEEKPGKYLM